MKRSTDYELFQNVPRPVGAMAKSYPRGYTGFQHSHPRAQLLCAETGTLRVTTDRGIWMVPPRRAVWFPCSYPHQTGTVTAVEMLILYIRPDACPKDAALEPCVIPISPLLRELIRRATMMPIDYDERGHEGKIISLLLDEIRWSPAEMATIPRLRDRRLRAIEGALTSNPGDTRTLEQWADLAGASPRTLARLFLREAGMSFRCWRDQFRALMAIAQLSNGRSITELAGELGYETSGAFSAMFRRVMGMTPSQFLSEIFEERAPSVR